MTQEKNLIVVEKQAMPQMTLSELQTMGKIFEDSGMFGCNQKGQGFVLALTCYMEKMTPLSFREKYNFIDGMPAMKASEMLANLLRLNGGYKILKRTDEIASIEVWYKETRYISTMSFKEFCGNKEPFLYAKDGGYKKNWRTPHSRMQTLWARAVSDGVSAVCPLASKNNVTPEEILDGGANYHEETVIQTTAVTVDEKTAASNFSEMTSGESAPAEEKKPAENLALPEKQDENQIDFSLIPAGDLKGKPWTDLTDKQLEKCLAMTSKKMLDGHRKAIKKILDDRKAAANG